ncbi:MAG TPA: S41 family peptidase [Gemmatimonadaceae bacterium]
MMMARHTLLAIAALLGVACTDAPTLTGTNQGAAVTNEEVFDAVWGEFDRHYSYFQVKGVDWDAMRATYRPQALNAPSSAELAKVIGNMLNTLRDRHVSLTPTGSGSIIRYLTRADSQPSSYDSGLIESHYVTAANTTNGGHVRYGYAAPTVGYIRIPTFEGDGWAGEIDAAIAALPQAQSMIVDVRGNPGGSHDLAIQVAGRFATSSVVYSYTKSRNGPGRNDFTGMTAQTVSPAGPRQFTGPVTVLTDRRVYSSAENFTLALSSFPNVTTVGDTTAGASGKPITRELPNGWTYTLSTWVEYTADKKVYENIGLAPDVYAGPTVRAGVNRTDPTMDRAIAAMTR